MGQAVIMKRGVLVAVNVRVVVVVGKAVTTKRGVLVAVPEDVTVAVPVIVPVAVDVIEVVGLAVGGRAVGLTEAASLPTVKSTPQTSGRERVAE